MAEKRNNQNTSTRSVISANEFGKLPPQAPELEESILGAIMVEPGAIEHIELVPRDFYKVAHQIIFQAILGLKESHNPIDMHTVTEELRRMGEIDTIGGPYYITKLTAGVSSAAHMDYHALIVKQKSIARQLIEMAGNISVMAYDDKVDVSDTLEFVEQAFTEISSGSVEAESYDMNESIQTTIDYLSEIQRKAELNISTSIPTGLDSLNRTLDGGFQAPDLVILGARPSMGKTQLAVHFAKNFAMSDQEGLFVSIEMTKIQLDIRLITEEEGINYHNMKMGRMTSEEWQLLEKRIAELLRLKINIADDYKIRNLANIKSLARKLHRQGKLKWMIIDYLQLIKTNQKFQTRDLEIGYITGELKSLAKELNIPIILLCQLNRPQKGVRVERPKLEDLRESGNIEQDADIVIFIHRPTYYNPNEVDSMDRSWKNRGILYMGKHREGEKDAKVLFEHDERFKKILDDGGAPVTVSAVEGITQNNSFYPKKSEQVDLPF